MSATTPTQPDIVSPEQAFDEAVWHNPECCNGCFEAVKEVDQMTIKGVVADHDVEEHSRTPSASLEQDEIILEFVDGRPGPQRSAIPRTTCLECGRVGCWAKDDDLSRIEATQRTKRIFPWLRELGVEFDRRTISQHVWQAKSDPENQGSETEVYRAAVAAGIRASR